MASAICGGRRLWMSSKADRFLAMRGERAMMHTTVNEMIPKGRSTGPLSP
jgi:hypothetical protein